MEKSLKLFWADVVTKYLDDLIDFENDKEIFQD